MVREKTEKIPVHGNQSSCWLSSCLPTCYANCRSSKTTLQKNTIISIGNHMVSNSIWN